LKSLVGSPSRISGNTANNCCLRSENCKSVGFSTSSRGLRGRFSRHLHKFTFLQRCPRKARCRCCCSILRGNTLFEITMLKENTPCPRNPSGNSLPEAFIHVLGCAGKSTSLEPHCRGGEGEPSVLDPQPHCVRSVGVHGHRPRSCWQINYSA
jgi:hypothetical protein